MVDEEQDQQQGQHQQERQQRQRMQATHTDIRFTRITLSFHRRWLTRQEDEGREEREKIEKKRQEPKEGIKP